MITRLSAGIVGLLTFAGMLVAGYSADNPLSTIVLRALAGLACGMVAGYAAGYVGHLLIDEQFRKMVQRDIDGELKAGEGEPKPAGEKSENSQNVGSGTNKATGENIRSSSQVARSQTLASRAAREVAGQS
jgi:hypothetical protein